ncbi:MAG: bifunctional metallophosphatase/5'-nucleotidase, partial [Bacteroidales bacterium]|nr:bifunctional metallophosphatase/5'-nucleotidase [Bacteroidales bacterium]
MKKPILNALKHILILSVFLFVSCTKQTQLRIIVTSDIHGLVFPYDFVNQREADGSLAQLETYLKQFESKDDYVLLDNGDFLQGQPSVYHSNFVDKKSWHITSFAMNRLGYDAA